jgi:AcrR family transcriptional regulator
MPRPRPTADAGSRERLLLAGLALARRRGIKAMTVRAVATEAGANLGSFVYHFGSREHFVDELIERAYAPMFERLSLVADAPGDALAALRTAMLQLVRWLVEHRDFVAQLVLDAGAGEAGARRFLRSLDRRHPALLLRLIVNAQQAGRIRRDDPTHQMLFLMSALAAPVLMFHLLGQHDVAPPDLVKALSACATDPESIEARLDWALRGLAPEPRGVRR